MKKNAEVPDLIGNAAAGDRASLDQLLAEHADELVAYITRRPGITASEARDVAQQVLVTAAKKVTGGELDPERSFPGFLRETAKNKLLHFYRSKRRSDRTGMDDLLADLNLPETPSHAVRQDDADRAIQAAIQQLTPMAAKCIRKRFFENKTLEQTARECNCTLGAVRAALASAETQLREILGTASNWTMP